MVIYMKHPEHGSKVAISEIEAIYDETHGWVRYNLDTTPLSAASERMKVYWATKRLEKANGDVLSR